MITANEEVSMFEWNTLEDIFSQSIIDPIANYRDIITSGFLDKNLLKPFITETINNGNEKIVEENIDALDAEKSWEIAENNPKFKEIFLRNFARAISNSKVSGTILNQINMEDASLIIDNWKTITKGTKENSDDRMDFISILNLSDEGRSIVDSQLSTLFYGDYSYGYFLGGLLSNEIVSKDKIADLILNDPTKMLTETFKRECSRYEIEILLQSIDDILNTISSLDSLKVKDARNAMENVIIQKFDELLDKKLLVKRYDIDGNFEDQIYSVQILNLVKSFFMDKDKINEKLAENYDKISKYIDPEETIDFLNLYSGTDVEMEELDIETVMSRTFPNITDSNLQWAISKVAKELLQDQNLTLDKMQIYGQGHYSKVIKIGEYVFKVGDKRETPKIKNDKRILQPLFRRRLKGKNEENIFIEVQDVVEKDWYKDLTEEEIEDELYKVYKEIRDRGDKWTDPKKENVGRLLKPNTGIYNINGQQLKGANVAKGFIESENTEAQDILCAGELVVIDTDYKFDDINEKIKYAKRSIYKKLEKRYLQEKEAREEAANSKLLTSMIEISKSTVTHEDIKQVAGIVVRDKAIKNREEIEYTEGK